MMENLQWSWTMHRSATPTTPRHQLINRQHAIEKKVPAANTAAPLVAQGTGTKRTPTSAFDGAAGKDVYEPEKVTATRTANARGCWQDAWRPEQVGQGHNARAQPLCGV
jgi:hypothetical protein